MLATECFHSDATLENSILCFLSHLSHLSTGLNSELSLDVPSIPGLLDAPESRAEDRFDDSSIPNSSLASISPPLVPLLQVFLPAASST